MDATSVNCGKLRAVCARVEPPESRGFSFQRCDTNGPVLTGKKRPRRQEEAAVISTLMIWLIAA